MTFQQLQKNLPDSARVVWMHVASLGEYEQGLPILEAIKTNYPQHTVLLTFFSPSGYEARKNTPFADLVTYLPMDTRANARQFLDKVRPELALFIKYDIWPNYLFEMQKRKIPAVLVSAFFLKRHIFFKSYGALLRESLRRFSHCFVQDQNSKDLLLSIGIASVTVSGDTRFDRVAKILKRDNHLIFMEEFKGKHFCLVAGSTWSEDEEILVDYINKNTAPLKYVVAPRSMKPANIERLKHSLRKKTICFSEIEGKNLADYQVLLVDAVGVLTKIYNHADVAYVGGAFATGLHNTLEPGVYGIPVIIGPKCDRFKEVQDLVQRKGIHVVHHLSEFSRLMERFIQYPELRVKTGAINAAYIQGNTGATALVIRHVNRWLQ